MCVSGKGAGTRCVCGVIVDLLMMWCLMSFLCYFIELRSVNQSISEPHSFQIGLISMCVGV